MERYRNLNQAYLKWWEQFSRRSYELLALILTKLSSLWRASLAVFFWSEEISSDLCFLLLMWPWCVCVCTFEMKLWPAALFVRSLVSWRYLWVSSIMGTPSSPLCIRIVRWLDSGGPGRIGLGSQEGWWPWQWLSGAKSSTPRSATVIHSAMDRAVVLAALKLSRLDWMSLFGHKHWDNNSGKQVLMVCLLRLHAFTQLTTDVDVDGFFVFLASHFAHWVCFDI